MRAPVIEILVCSLALFAGTGKTFTLMTIAHSIDRPVFVIIYKHDLLSTFKYVAQRYTIAKFFMDLLGIQFCQYQALELQLSGRMNSVEFITCIVSMIRNAKMPHMQGGLVILDEYTVVPKPLLLLLLVLLKHYRIGTIICGDKNQLQNIHNSSHARCSSFDIASRFVDETFGLSTNERCLNSQYNDIIDYVANYSSDKRLDEFAFAMLSVLFPMQLGGSTKFTDVHLAATHRELARAVHMLVINERVPTSFYYISYGSTRNLDNVTACRVMADGLLEPPMVAKYVRDRETDKFLPYLPLYIGNKYYVFKHSEFSQATLTAIDSQHQVVTLRSDTGDDIVTTKSSNHDAIFEAHRIEILNGGAGKVYNYPIYPVNLMTIHKCQGCTIRDNLDLLMTNANYQGLYVTLSRVRDPQQIVRVIVPNMISHLVSVIVNVEEHSTGEPVTVDVLKRVLRNYTFYDLDEPGKFADLASRFLEGREDRREIRRRVIDQTIEMSCRSRILQPPAAKPQDDSMATIQKFVDHLDTFLALSCVMDELERNVWLHEFMLRSPDMILLRTETHAHPAYSENFLGGFAGLNNTYPLTRSSSSYIKERAKRETPPSDNYTIERTSDVEILTTHSRFLHEVYERYEKGEETSITVDWLVEQLNEMTDRSDPNITVEPRKQPTAKRRCSSITDFFSSTKPSSTAFSIIKRTKKF